MNNPLSQPNLDLTATSSMSNEVYLFPVSFTQQRQCFLNQLEGPSATYTNARARSLQGTLDVPALEQAIQTLVQRHETLRTTFRMIDNALMQIIRPSLTLSIPRIDLTQSSPEEQSHQVQSLIQEFSQHIFNLETGPLIRVSLAKLSAENHVLLLAMHHIITDGWSTQVFWQEFCALYHAFSQGQPSPLADLPIQYADYTVWQQEWLQGEVFANQLAYWKQQLGGELPILQLPIDRPRPLVQTYNGSQQTITIAADVTQALKSLSQTANATLFMTLLAAFQTLLHRYSGQTDIIVGTPIAGRNPVETESLIGLFANLLALRTDLAGNPTFRQLVERVREVALGAYSHADIPFEKLVEELRPRRDSSRSPLFQVAFSLKNFLSSEIELSGLVVKALPMPQQVAKLDLILVLQDTPEGLITSFEYNTDLFDNATIVRMLGHWQTLLHGIVSNPDQPIGQLPLLTEAERHQILVEWNDTASDYPKDKCIHQLFEEQVERTPEATALVFENYQLTYRELNTRANQLARYLQKKGVGPETIVGVALDRSLEMIVSVIGVLKAGGAYVPLDPALPPSRLSYMVKDSGTKVLLSQMLWKDQFSEFEGHWVDIIADWSIIAQEDTNNLPTPATRRNLVYTIYTSGSTGHPKGVMVEHHSLCGFAAPERLHAYHVKPDSHVLMFGSLSFSTSLSEIFMTLLVGATLYIASLQSLLSGPKLACLLQDYAITHIKITPSMLSMIPNADFPALSVITVMGEPTSVEVLRRWLPNRTILSSYGATEVSVLSTCTEYREENVKLSIGRPVSNTKVYLLDAHLQPVPINVPGEIYIAGIGLARGYLNQPELTAERFLPDPFDCESGTLMYKTGDLACYLPDGQIFYLGRGDDQVKIRGIRIELGEIQAALNQHPLIEDAVVIAREDQPGEKYLAAYIVPNQHQVPSPEELRQFLRQKLPNYMIPSAFVPLDSIPLTLNGKIDRLVLPKPDWQQPSHTLELPRNAIEQEIALIWAEVLQLKHFGIQHNFFELGGHSLTAIQVIGRVCDRFQLNIPLHFLFEYPTIAELASAIGSLKPENLQRETPKISTRRREAKRIQLVKFYTFNSSNNDMNNFLSQSTLDLTGTTNMSDEVYLFPVSFAQQRLWFLDQLEGPSATYTNASARSLQGTLHLSALEHTIQTLVQRHETLRTTFRVIDNALMQVIRISLTLSIPQIDLTQLSSEEQSSQIQAFIQNFAQHKFDLQTGPLIRVSLVQLSAQEHILLLAMHHIITDGWSMQVFWQEFATLYQAFSQGQPSPLADLPIQYADYTLWQQEWLQGEVYADQLAYWKQQLAGELPLLQLPIDRPRPLVQTYNGSQQTITIAADVSQALKSLSQTANATLFMTLLAAFQTLLHRYSGQTDIIVGTPIAGRNPVETESLIGFFANTLALRTDLTGNPTFRQLIERVREVALGAYSHADIPFEKLVEELRPQRDPSRSPLFQVMFSLKNFASNRIDLPELVVESLPMSQQTAKFDLSLAVQETAEGLRTRLEYNTDLFDDATVTRMLGHWQTLLDGIVSNPDQPIGQLPLLTPAERDQILVTWNDTAADYPRDKCIHQLFEEQVERTPEAIAVVFEDKEITYRELNIKADLLAQYLQSLDVKPGDCVGVCLEQSLEMVIALLGIIKAGGAYVPIDPTYPQERLEFMLSDAQISILLTQQQHAEKFSECSVNIALDSDWENIQTAQQNSPISQVTTEDIAYIMYTSGSTGKPKGVLVPHRAVNRLVLNTNYIQLTSNDRIAQAANPAFDATTFEIWGALLQGACLVFTPQQILLSFQKFAEYIQEQKITVLFLTTALFNQIASLMPQSFGTLRYLLVGGEAIDPQWMRKVLLEKAPQHLLHVYGPTENTTFSSWFLVKDVPETAATIPIGRPIANTQIYLLDQHLQPVPVGVTGELYLGGDGLALGYLNHATLTDTQFIPNPFGTGCLYRTGDLGRYCLDGNLEFVGRVDHQVKIRGFRIELGEIEMILTQHPQVEEAVVMVRKDQSGEKYIVAYIVPDQRQVPSSQELRQFLKQQLPNYMMPSAFVPLEAIPLTSNGKLDRRALPAPDWRQQTTATFVAPRTATERQLAEIWKTVLWREQPVGIHDNFFDIGGHSLLAIHLVAEIEKAFETKLPLSSLFQLETIAELAKVLNAPVHQVEAEMIGDAESKNIRETRDDVQQVLRLDPEIYRQLLVLTSAWKGQRVAPDSLVVGLNTEGTRPPLFWCFQGFRELSQMAKYIGEDQPVYGMRSGHLIMQYTEENVQALANHYVQEILRIQPEGPYRLGGNCQAGKIMFTIAQLLQQQNKPVALLCLLEAFIPKPYFGPVALFFGQESDRFNPYKSFSEPELGYRKYYRGGFSITIVSGDHGQYFNEPNIQMFTGELRQALDQANADEQAILTLSAYQAHISSVSSLTFVPGETYSLTVTVKNMSPVTWLATEQSGIFLANHWMDEKGDVICWMDGRTAIDRNLAPSESLQLEITVTAPTELGQYQLELDLVEEGITWFKNKGSESSVVQVEVSELNGIQGEARQKFRYLQQDENLNQNVSVNYSQAANLSIVEDIQSLQMGDNRFMKGDFAGAIAHYEKAIQQNPAQSANLYLNLGKALSRTGKATEAIAYCQKAIQLAPNSTQAYEQLGTIQRKQGDLEGAIASYQIALQLDPGLAWIYSILGEMYAKREQLESAIAAYQAAVEHLEDKPDLYIHLGNLLMKQGDLDAAIASFQQALALNIEGGTIYIRLGTALSQKGQLEDAVVAYRQALVLSPNNAYAYTMLGHTQKKQEAFEDAINSYQQAIQYTSQPHPGTYKSLGDCCRQLGKTAEAIAAYQQACVLQPGSAGLYRQLGDVQFQDGAIEASIASYQTAIELEPQQPFAVYKRLGDLLRQTGAIEAAVLAYQAALQLQPHNQAVQQVLDKLTMR